MESVNPAYERNTSDLPTFVVAVSVDVVASEEDIRLVAVDNLCEPSQRLASGRLAEVLLVDLGLVAPAKDMVSSLTGDGQGLLESVVNIQTLRRVARSVDEEVVDGTSIPYIRGSSRRSGRGSGGWSALARNERRSKNGRSCKEHERRDTGSHCEHYKRFVDVSRTETLNSE
jgi:hypothetical protein